jgi:hypothetical protein
MAAVKSEILQLKSDIDKQIEKSEPEPIKEMLGALAKLTLTTLLLSETKIGVSVNNVKKTFKGHSIEKPAADLVGKWKAMVGDEKAKNARTSSRPKKTVDYNEDTVATVAASSASTQAVPSSDDPARNMKLKTKIKKQIGQGPLPTRNEHGEFLFPDYPDFRPNLSPKEVLQMGSFGGTYFRPIKSGCTGLTYGPEVWQELPEDWLKGLNIKVQVSSPTYRTSVNRYGVKCGGDLEMWESSGWMRDSDPYGWFQWYCRFFQGRRCSDDERQVARGLACMGEKGRWRSTLSGKIADSIRGARTVEAACEDYKISPVVRQTLQHWGYRVNPRDLIAYRKRTGR